MLFHTGYEPYFEVVRGKVFLNCLIERLKWPAACEANFREAEGGDTWETLDVDSILKFDGCSIDVPGKSSCSLEDNNYVVAMSVGLHLPLIHSLVG